MPPKRPVDDFEEDFEAKSTRDLMVATRRDLIYLNRDLAEFTRDIKGNMGDHDSRIRALELCGARVADPTVLEKRVDGLAIRIGELETKIAYMKGGIHWTDYLIMAVVSAAVAGMIGLVFWYVMNK